MMMIIITTITTTTIIIITVIPNDDNRDRHYSGEELHKSVCESFEILSCRINICDRYI